MKRTVRRFLYNILTVFMAVLMASMTAVQVFAAGRNTDKKTERDIASGKLYVKDVIIVTESEKINLSTTAAYQDYVVLSDPIKTFAADSGHESLYFAVKTTENPDEAITDIKAMNMNGDYSFDAYREYLDEVEAWASAKAATTMTALETFRKNYKAGTPNAIFAYNMMNYLAGDREEVPLGDFFVSDEYKSEHSIQVKNIVTKANYNTLTYFRQLLLVACAENTGEQNFVDKLRTHNNANDLIPDPEYSKYNTAAEDLMYSMVSTRESLIAFHKADFEQVDVGEYLSREYKKIEPILNDKSKAGTDEYKEAEEKEKTFKSIYTGMVISQLFGDVYYTDNNGVHTTLPDIFIKDPDAEKDEERLTADMLLPIVAQMNDGQRALCGCGFDELVASVINDYNENSEYKESLEAIKEFWAEISEKELVSVYAGVDLSLYDPNGIAMVGKSGEFLQKADKAMGTFAVKVLASGIMAGGAVVGMVGSCALCKKGYELAQQGIHDFNEATKFGDYLIKRTATDMSFYPGDAKIKLANDKLLANNMKLKGFNLQALGYFTLAVSVIILVFSIVTFILSAIEAGKPGEYLQVPRVLVTAIEKDEYDERQQKTTHTQMVFYKGIIDPFMSDEKAKTNASPSKVQDLLDWSLEIYGREWIALYTTKDGRVGNPIIFDEEDNTLFTLIEKDGKTYSTLEVEKGFNSRVNIFNKEDYTVCGNGVIVYNRDLDVTSTTKTGLGASMNISSGYFILFILIAVMAGAGVGVGATCLINKSRKKKLAASH